MCGIIGVVASRSTRAVPAMVDLLAQAETVTRTLSEAAATRKTDGLITTLDDVSDALATVDSALRGGAGLRGLLEDPERTDALDRALDQAGRYVDALDELIETQVGPASIEAANAAMIRLRDLCWAIREDRVANARAVEQLAGPDAGGGTIECYAAIELAMSGLDRLEVRGRDSAGLHVQVTGHGLDLSAPDVVDAITGRDDPLFGSRAVRNVGGALSFVYKAASEIGRLGDNGAALRAAIRDDQLLRAALQADTAQAGVMGHTRWASVGMINEANAHPLTGEEIGDGAARPYVVAALNGDVDNHRELRIRHELDLPLEITTDAKVIPVLAGRHIEAGSDVVSAFRQTVAELDGSVAISAQAIDEPGLLLLAVRGSGQALYVGSAEDMYVVASEPYGLVETCRDYLRIDGESLSEEDG